MQSRSNLYNRMMQSDLRDVTTASIYIGAVNQKAQSNNLVQGSFWKYADVKSPFDPDSKVENVYFSWEEKLNKLDGSMCFSPETDNEVVYNQGIVSECICTDVTKPEVFIQFAVPQLDIKGLTIDFGESYPKEFSIETNLETKKYSLNTRFFLIEDVFENIDYMKIIPGTMSNGRTRLRINRILFGIGIGLTGKKIISMNIKEKTHPISLELPTVDFSFKVDNQDRYFNANADDSVINFLERGQNVRAYFTQTLEDGSTETINAVNTLLDSTWKDKDTTAEFSATDVLYQMDGLYEDGIYRKDGITAYDLAVDVFEKAGVEPDAYSLDTYLKGILIRNPLPKDTYANCILLIANACRCVMKQDREMRVIVKASFIPDLFTSAETEAVYSDATQLLSNLDIVNYFEWQKEYNRLDGSMYFKPEGEGYFYSGYISNEISDSEGNFETAPVVAVRASAAFTFYQMTLQFGNVYPREAIVHCYNSGNEIENFRIEISNSRHIIQHSFTDVDMVKIEFTKAAAYNRIYLHNISVEETTDYTIHRDDMLSKPVTERQDRIKDLIAVRTVYSKPDITENIFSDTIAISKDNSLFKMEFNSASIPVSIVTTVPSNDEENMEPIAVDYGAEIIHYSNWYCEVRFNNPPQEDIQVNVSIQGYIFKVTTPRYVLNVNTSGTTPDVLQNPLIDSVEMIKPYAQWCADYYSAKAEYTMSKMLGDPVLESNDLAFYEDEDGSVRLIRVHTINLKFDGTYNGSSCSGRSI